MTTHEDIIIHPRMGKREAPVPECGIMLVTPAEMQYGRALLLEQGGRDQFIFSSSLTIARDDSFFIAGPAIGAPVAAMTMEKLIALGARKIVMYGWCGTIAPELVVGDVVIGGEAVSGEGTSRYYPVARPQAPCQALVKELAALLDTVPLRHSQRNVWSTDAPYREDRRYISSLHDNADVCGVDMEYSALCAVAAFRAIEFAGLFLISDELYRPEWRPGYTQQMFRQKSRELVQLLTGGGLFRRGGA